MTAVAMAEPTYASCPRLVYNFYPQYRLTTTSPRGGLPLVLDSETQDTGCDLEALLRILQEKLQECALTGQLHVALQACRGPPDENTEKSWEDVCAFEVDAPASQDISMESLLQRLQMGLQQGVRTGTLQSALQATKGFPDNGDSDAPHLVEDDAAGASCDQRYELAHEVSLDLKRRLSSNLLHGVQNGDLRGALIATRDINSAASAV